MVNTCACTGRPRCLEFASNNRLHSPVVVVTAALTRQRLKWGATYNVGTNSVGEQRGDLEALGKVFTVHVCACTCRPHRLGLLPQLGGTHQWLW